MGFLSPKERASRASSTRRLRNGCWVGVDEVMVIIAEKDKANGLELTHHDLHNCIQAKFHFDAFNPEPGKKKRSPFSG